MPNWENINKTLARIEADPDAFDMAVYYAETTCGTVACLAGHACLEKGLMPAELSRVSVEARESDFYQPDQWRPWMRNGYHQTSLMREAKMWGAVHIEEAARKYLGLSYDEAGEIFNAYGVRTVEDLRLKIKEVLGDEH
jgi:hypothetical protein